MVKIPIIILNWFGIEDTKECMRSLLAMNGGEFEIILIDNGSSIEEQNELVTLYSEVSNVTVKCNTYNKGFTKGNSDEVSTILEQEELPEFIILLNNDTVVTPDWFDQLVGTARKNDADMVSSKMINYFNRGLVDNLGHYMLNTGEILPLGHGSAHKEYQSDIENVGACGGAALYRVSMIQEIGFFDLFFDTGYEDAEYGLRAKLLGYKCIMASGAKVYHKVSQSINKIRDDRYMQGIQINIFYTYIKLMPRKFLLFNMPFVIIKYLLWFFIGLFTLQFRIVKLYAKTVNMFFRQYFKPTIANRKKFQEHFQDQIVYKNKLLAPTYFFFATDISRALRRMR